MAILFGLALTAALYSYTLYPLLVCLLARVKPNPWTRGDGRPSVAVIISAYNEESVIRERVLNALALAYPENLLEVIVSSDGSTDRTNEIVGRIDDARLTLHAAPHRSGKTACLNRSVPRTRGDILVFTDANTSFPSDLLEKLVRNFASPDVGLVTGWTRYGSAGQETGSIGPYSLLERNTKEWESQIASCVGADGAVFAMRKRLFRELAPQDINDFVLPLHVVRQGYRAILDAEVFCVEGHTEDQHQEFRRQLRITTRTLGAIARNMDLLNPWKVGIFAYFLISHKVLRFLAPYFLLTALVTNIALVNRSPAFAALLLGQALVLGLGLAGIAGWRRSGVARLTGFLVVTFGAQTVAWFRAFRGKSEIIWTPRQ